MCDCIHCEVDTWATVQRG